eukprot:2172866-Pleurochrysis_carterae.AAC.5
MGCVGRSLPDSDVQCRAGAGTAERGEKAWRRGAACPAHPAWLSPHSRILFVTLLRGEFANGVWSAHKRTET